MRLCGQPALGALKPNAQSHRQQQPEYQVTARYPWTRLTGALNITAPRGEMRTSACMTPARSLVTRRIRHLCGRRRALASVRIRGVHAKRWFTRLCGRKPISGHQSHQPHEAVLVRGVVHAGCALGCMIIMLRILQADETLGGILYK
jgi:hypothetical protein